MVDQKEDIFLFRALFFDFNEKSGLTLRKLSMGHSSTWNSKFDFQIEKSSAKWEKIYGMLS